MLNISWRGYFWATLLFSISTLPVSADDGELKKSGTKELLEKSTALAKSGRMDEALQTASKAIGADPKNVDGYLLRSALYSRSMNYEKAIADLDEALSLNPDMVAAYDLRGDLYLKSGAFKAAIADFDVYLKRKPERTPHHWRRGIAYYYAGEYVKGQEQFEGYQKVDSSDVENAVWRCLCMARGSNLKKARAELLKIGHDSRVPMKEIYELFGGEIKASEVLEAARAGDPPRERRDMHLFYAHLYLGLYYEVEGNQELARKHITMAAEKYRIGHYMWDVARVHAELFRKGRKVSK